MSHRNPEQQWTDSLHKRKQLEREIAAIEDVTLRNNLQHTLSKLLMFIDDDVDAMLRKAWREGPPAAEARPLRVGMTTPDTYA